MTNQSTVRDQGICVDQIKTLLEKNKLRKAFELIDERLMELGFSTDLTPYVVATSSQFFRTENEYRLGSITWEQYDIASTKIVEKTLLLTKDICQLLTEQEKGPNTWAWIWIFLKSIFMKTGRKEILFKEVLFSDDHTKTKDQFRHHFEELLKELETLKPLDKG